MEEPYTSNLEDGNAAAMSKDRCRGSDGYAGSVASKRGDGKLRGWGEMVCMKANGQKQACN